MVMKRWSVYLVAAALAAGMLTVGSGCSVKKQGGEEEGGGDLQLVSFYDIFPDDETTAVGAAIKAYEKETGSKVTFKQYDYSIYNNKLVQMVAGGNAPDIMFAYWGDMPRIAAIDLIQPVDNLVDISKQNLPNLMESYTWKGKHYAGSVQQVQGPLLWYNKNLLAKEGVNKTPYQLWKDGQWDWNAFLDIGKKVTRDTDGDGETDQWGYNTAYPEYFIWSNNANAVRVGNDGVASICWKEQPYITSMKFLQDIRFKNIIMPQDFSKAGEDFSNGKLAMAGGTYEFMGARIEESQCDPDMFGVAPFPTGPDFDGYYYGKTNLMTVASGAKNPKGAGRLCELVCEKERELFGDKPNLASPKFTKHLTDEHMEVIQHVTGITKVNYDSGWGEWDPTYIYQRSLYYDTQDVVTTLDTIQPLLQTAINDLMNSAIPLGETFKAPEPENFEKGLQILSVDQAEDSGVTQKPDEVVDGTASLKLTATGTKQVLAHTDPTKLRVVPYKTYKVTLQYKILSAEGEKAEFALTSRSLEKLNSEDDQTGWFRFAGKPGDTGSVEGTFELTKSGVQEYVFVLASGASKGSVAIDGLIIADVTPVE